jgi:hypothetical protein
MRKGCRQQFFCTVFLLRTPLSFILPTPGSLSAKSRIMLSTEETLATLRREMRPLLETAMESVLTKVRRALEGAEQERADGLVQVAGERAKVFTEVAEERAKGLAEVDSQRTELLREIAAMRMHREAQEGRVQLNVGGHRFETSVQALRRIPHTFFDAYFSGRYAQDVCNDGSIFVDRDGEHFGHVLEYMRDGHVSVAEAGARPSVSLLRTLKREFGFYCIELCTEQPEPGTYPAQADLVFVVGGEGDGFQVLSSMKRYDIISGQWVVAAAMSTARRVFGTCAVAGKLYVTGGRNGGSNYLSSVEKYSPSTDTWSSVTPLATAHCYHAAVAMGPAMYVLGGFVDGAFTGRVQKFDSTQGTWREVAPMPEARFAHAACVIGSDIYVFGGCDNIHKQRDSVFMYDTFANIWTTLAPMPTFGVHPGVPTLDDRIYLAGMGGSGQNAHIFDPASGVWSSLTPTMHNRQQGSLFVLGGCVHAAGGHDILSSVERYDGGTDTWTAAADMLEDRRLFGAVTIPAARPAEGQNFFDVLIAKATG